jgi:hypothetical protein
MTRIASLLTMLVTAVACLLPAAPAFAQRDRVFVASYGDDSNPCTFGSPCKTFQNAVNVVGTGGEVTAIDSAGFGPVSITKSVTITSRRRRRHPNQCPGLQRRLERPDD